MSVPWTSGPWEAIPRPDHDRYDIDGAGEPWQGPIANVAFFGDDSQNAADARLIAAAPEMAKLLHEARTWMERANEPDDENQTKEQYRLYILDELATLLFRIRGEAEVSA
jgi:hypothetical protein